MAEQNREKAAADKEQKAAADKGQCKVPCKT